MSNNVIKPFSSETANILDKLYPISRNVNNIIISGWMCTIIVKTVYVYCFINVVNYLAPNHLKSGNCKTKPSWM